MSYTHLSNAIVIVLVVAILAAVAFTITGAAVGFTRAERCREAGGVPVKTADRSVVCLRADALALPEGP